MSNLYDPGLIEPRWQRRWAAEQPFAARNPGDAGFDPTQPKFYLLDMFPYPSGSGLHVGHAVGYIGSDVVARRKRMEGRNVLHPMGWDAFGLPAEQYALQTGKHPAETTAVNTANFRRQLERIGLSYDWGREIDTSDPRYYRWTQWLFKRLWERGLAYRSEVPVWWCEELKTVLANEEVINGRSERGNHPCVRRPLKQWMLRITAYAERLLFDLDGLDWPESIKTQQREWIGRSEGAEIEFEVEGRAQRLVVFTTRPDTVWGATFLVVAPEHPLIGALAGSPQAAAVSDYAAAAAQRSEIERAEIGRAKTGVFTGLYARNPVFTADEPGARIPVWVADYVLASYGSGAIMGVPGQDQRDWEFAARYGLRIVRTVQPPADWQGQAWTGEGPAIHSGWLDGLDVEHAKQKTVAWLEQQGRGRSKVTYKLRDWLFSRQRYWGEPFPLLHETDGSITPVPDEDLPVELPPREDFRPSPDGSPPLARAREWVLAKSPRTSRPARRDTDTMPGWAGSCWYWLRFMDPGNEQAAFSPESERYWGPVDLYIGGAAHAVMHLLYARFWHKVLFDEGLVSNSEPFQRLFNQGLITAFAYQDSSGRLVPNAGVEPRGAGFVRAGSGEELVAVVTKMAKQLGNVVNPDDVIAEYGADTLRVYQMFMGPLADSKPWNPRDIAGSRRFLERVWRLYVDEEGHDTLRAHLRVDQQASVLQGPTAELERFLNRALQRLDDSFSGFNFNTAIAALMEFVNQATRRPGALSRGQAERLVLALSPFAPHLCEELWSRLGYEQSLAREPWPIVDPALLVDETVEIAVQVNGKVRGRVVVPAEAHGDQPLLAAREAVAKWIEGKELVRTVVIPGKLVNLIVR